METFPNTFLGVCLSDQSYREMPRPLRRGRKFDWLYDQWVSIPALVASLPLPDGSEQLPHLVACTKNHDERAALVCLLAALLVAQGAFTAVVRRCSGGLVFLLVPVRGGKPWARKALEEGRQRWNKIRCEVARHSGRA